MNLIRRRYLEDVKLTVNCMSRNYPENPSKGDKFIFLYTDNYQPVMEYNGSNWVELQISRKGTEVFNLETGELLEYNTTTKEWQTFASLNGYLIVDDLIEDAIGSAPTNGIHNDNDRYVNTEESYSIYKYSATNSEWIEAKDNEDNYMYGRGILISLSDYKVYFIRTPEEGVYYHSSLALRDGQIIFSKADNSLYLYTSANRLEKIAPTTQSGGGQSEQTVSEVKTLSAAEATAKQFQLSNSMRSDKTSCTLLFYNGVIQIPNVDYSIVNNNTISWASNAVSLYDTGTPKSGDTFLIQYIM